MKKHRQILIALAAAFWFLSSLPAVSASDNCKAVFGEGQQTIRLATGSPGELGLLEALAEAFNRTRPTRVNTIIDRL